jgi:hypothetical protein
VMEEREGGLEERRLNIIHVVKNGGDIGLI